MEDACDDVRRLFEQTSYSLQYFSKSFPAPDLSAGTTFSLLGWLQQIATSHATQFIDGVQSRTATKQGTWR
jgi:hypothetical protein